MKMQISQTPFGGPTRLRCTSYSGRSRATAVISTLAVLAIGVWGGCSSGPVERRDRPVAVADQAQSWETVFASPSVLFAGAGGAGDVDANQGWEYARNDHRLNARTDSYLSASSEWPERERPRLDRARRISLPRDANQIIYFRTESEFRSTGGRSTSDWWY